ncbi:MAG TPA: serine/threonine-protein kinase [Anaerolineae bacterium]|nr:serine/threonine-protein kinase [Anaerolineae bacterium]
MPDLSNQTLGQYRLIKPIGAGGMATIYKAYQPALDRVVAIKILPEFLLNQPGFIDRFKIEAQAVAKLDHPHIVPIYDFGQAGQAPYLVMKYVPAGTLKDLLTEPLEPQRAAAILRQIAEALDHAHQQGVVHRDVKPSNVLMQDGRWVQLTDFGLAKILTHTSQLTASGASVGTPDYMSPEQAQGERVDARSDIYSLGVILYQMLTGEVPFHAETPTGVMLKHVLEPPPPPRAVNPAISPAVEEVILRALAKSPDDRFPRATDLADAFERALDPNATRVTLRRPSTFQARLPWLLGLGAIVVLIALLVVSQLPAPAPLSNPNAAAASGQSDAILFDDFGAPTIDATRWAYTGTYAALLDSDAVSIRDGRLTFQAENAADDYYDGGVQAKLGRAFDFISARVTLLDATGNSDIGIQVNGIDAANPDSWAYIAMSPSDASVYAYVIDAQGEQQTYNLLLGTGMPATHELAIGWDGAEMAFYVDGNRYERIPTSVRGQWFQLLFDVEPNGRLSGSFDDVRVTYGE